jgi:hypothetical protein
MLLMLYCLPLLFKVWQRSGLCCWCYIVYYFSLMFDRRVVHVVVVILSTITVLGLTGEWFMLFCYIVYNYCFRFDKGVVYVVVILYTITVLGLTEEWFVLLMLYCLPLLFKVWQRSGSCCWCYIVFHCSLRFDRGVVHVVVVILSTITV